MAAGAELYLVKDMDDYTRVGFGVFAPDGAILRYKNDWVGRYAAGNGLLMAVDLNPSVAFKLDEHSNLGIGIFGEYMYVQQKSAVDVKNGVLQMARDQLKAERTTQGPLVDTYEGSHGCTQATAAQRDDCVAHQFSNGVSGDGSVDVDMGNFGVGWNLGYLFELTDKTRFSIAYRSGVRHNLKGQAKWDFSQVIGQVPDPSADPISTATGTARQVNVADYIPSHVRPDTKTSLLIHTPETVSVGAFHEIDKLALMADVTWTRNSRLNELRLQLAPANGIEQGDAVIHTRWKDTYRYALGVNYRVDDKLMLRSGIAYDETPVRNPETRFPGFPDANRYWVSFGANYKLKDKTTLDLAYSYVWFDRGDVNYTDSCNPAGYNLLTKEKCTGNGGTFRGSYETHLHMVGLQLNRPF